MFITMSAFLHSCFDSESNIETIQHEEVAEFRRKCCEDCLNFCDIFEYIENLEIKSSFKKYPAEKIKQAIAFVYMKIMIFTTTQQFIPNIVIKIILESVNSVMESKTYFHNSHIIGEIPYARSFCNWKVKENKDFFYFLFTIYLVLTFSYF